MKLLYLTHANLADNLFIKDLVHNFKYDLDTKVLLLHDAFGTTVRDTRFVTKRLSTLFSETMTYNNAFMAQQRGLFRPTETGYEVNVSLIEQLLLPINLLIVGPVVDGPDGAQLAEGLDLLAAARTQLNVEETILFTQNPMSPLGRKKPVITEAQTAQELLGVYEEEEAAIRLAQQLRPVTLASPVTYAM